MELNELQEQIKRCNSLSDISSVQGIDANTLFMSILKAERYDLLKNNNINIITDLKCNNLCGHRCTDIRTKYD